VRPADRFGIAWKPALATGILAHLGRLDVVEVMAEDFAGSRRRLSALRTLARQVPVAVHAVSLGLASTIPVDRARLRDVARAVDAANPLHWSEHLAFVRAGGIEIGHLAAPPRTRATIAGLAANVARATEATGRTPLLENVATLIDPPGSDLSEADFVAGALEATGADLLLDLHNLHANAVSFGLEEEGFLGRIPMQRVREIHLAGGRLVPEPGRSPGSRVLDDHLHAVPEAVFTLLESVAARAPQPLTVILERDGCFPPIEELLDEVSRARACVARGRERREAAA